MLNAFQKSIKFASVGAGVGAVASIVHTLFEDGGGQNNDENKDSGDPLAGLDALKKRTDAMNAATELALLRFNHAVSFDRAMRAVNRLLVSYKKVKEAVKAGEVARVTKWQLEAQRSNSVAVENLRVFLAHVEERHPAAMENAEELLALLQEIIDETVTNVLMETANAF